MLNSRIAFALLACAICSSCSLLTRPMERPVIEEGQRTFFFAPTSLGVLAITPERRVVLRNFSNGRSCSENPTEVGIDLSSAAKAVASAELQDKVKADLGLALAAASSNSILNRRSQGMQLYLARAYRICEQYMNGAIDEQTYLERQDSLFSAIIPLIAYELPYFYKDETGKPPMRAPASTPSQPVSEKTPDEMLPSKPKRTDGSPPADSAASGPRDPASAPPAKSEQSKKK